MRTAEKELRLDVGDARGTEHLGIVIRHGGVARPLIASQICLSKRWNLWVLTWPMNAMETTSRER